VKSLVVIALSFSFSVFGSVDIAYRIDGLKTLMECKVSKDGSGGPYSSATVYVDKKKGKIVLKFKEGGLFGAKTEYTLGTLTPNLSSKTTWSNSVDPWAHFTYSKNSEHRDGAGREFSAFKENKITYNRKENSGTFNTYVRGSAFKDRNKSVDLDSCEVYFKFQ